MLSLQQHPLLPSDLLKIREHLNSPAHELLMRLVASRAALHTAEFTRQSLRGPGCETHAKSALAQAIRYEHTLSVMNEIITGEDDLKFITAQLTTNPTA